MVDIQTAIDELNTGKIEFAFKDDDCCTTEGEVVILLKRLAELEKADVVEVKHGKWIQDGEYQICSVCGEEHYWDEYRATYCEDCGAKMDGQL